MVANDTAAATTPTAVAADEPPRDVSTFHPEALPFVIKPVAGKGLGCIATQRIPRGARILADKPLFTVPTAVRDLGVMKQVIASQLKTASREEQREFLSLTNAHKEHGALVGTASTNVHPMGGTGATEAGMFLVACRINHSCDHNAQNAWNPDIGRMTVHAIRDIAVGDEINLHYLTGVLRWAERRDTLSRFFGFECRCGRCAAPEERRRASDARRDEINQLDDRLGDGYRILNSPAESLRDAYRKICLLMEEGILDGNFERTYHDAFQVAVANGDEARGKVFAERDYAETVVSQGEDSPESVAARAYFEDPKRHKLFGKKMTWGQGVDKIPTGLSEEEFERWLWQLPKDAKVKLDHLKP